MKQTVSGTSAEEKKSVEDHLDRQVSDEFKPFRKHSEDIRVNDLSFIDKTKFNDPVPELVVNQEYVSIGFF